MRKSASWMTIWDDRILEYVDEEGSATPKKLDESGFIHVSRSQISRRLRRLAEGSLLEHLGNGVYVITDEGEAYLEEQFDVDRWSYVDNDEGPADVPADGTSGT